MGSGASFDAGWGSSDNGRYFCHSCHRVFGLGGVDSPLDYYCPHCQSTFLEELGANSFLDHDGVEGDRIISVRHRSHGQLTSDQSRRISNATAMLRLLETQLRDELEHLQRAFQSASIRINNQNAAQKPKKLSTVMLSKLRCTTVTLDMICSQPSCPICSEDFVVTTTALNTPKNLKSEELLALPKSSTELESEKESSSNCPAEEFLVTPEQAEMKCENTNTDISKSELNICPDYKFNCRQEIFGEKQDSKIAIPPDDDWLTQLPCSHLFHPNCILPWLEMKQNCPICRYEISDKIFSIEELIRLFSRDELLKKLQDLDIIINDAESKKIDELASLLQKHLQFSQEKEQEAERLRQDREREREHLQQQQQQQMVLARERRALRLSRSRGELEAEVESAALRSFLVPQSPSHRVAAAAELFDTFDSGRQLGTARPLNTFRSSGGSTGNGNASVHTRNNHRRAHSFSAVSNDGQQTQQTGHQSVVTFGPPNLVDSRIIQERSREDALRRSFPLRFGLEVPPSANPPSNLSDPLLIMESSPDNESRTNILVTEPHLPLNLLTEGTATGRTLELISNSSVAATDGEVDGLPDISEIESFVSIPASPGTNNSTTVVSSTTPQRSRSNSISGSSMQMFRNYLTFSFPTVHSSSNLSNISSNSSPLRRRHFTPDDAVGNNLGDEVLPGSRLT